MEGRIPYFDCKMSKNEIIWNNSLLWKERSNCDDQQIDQNQRRQ
jgi:hypothetical protein